MSKHGFHASPLLHVSPLHACFTLPQSVGYEALKVQGFSVAGEMCVIVLNLHWQIRRHACGATGHHRGGKATNTDKSRKH